MTAREKGSKTEGERERQRQIFEERRDGQTKTEMESETKQRIICRLKIKTKESSKRSDD